MPRISFDDPLPLGMESQAERLWIGIDAGTGCKVLMEKLNVQLPDGLEVTACRRLAGTAAKRPVSRDVYRIFHECDRLDLSVLSVFNEASQWPFTRRRSKGQARSADLKKVVASIESLDENCLELILLRNHKFVIRPTDILMGVFDIPQDQLAQFRVVKMADDDAALQ